MAITKPAMRQLALSTDKLLDDNLRLNETACGQANRHETV